MNQSDQITIPAELWATLDRYHKNHDIPMFVEVGIETRVVGRLRPAVPSEGLSNDSCRVPAWMWMRLGCPGESDNDYWTALTLCDLPTAGTLVLRARRETDVTGSVDPVAMLTDALSGASAGGLSWACLSTGSELPLPCGVFDVMEIRSLDDIPVPAACILNCDVNLECVPALDAVPPRPPTPIPPPLDVPIITTSTKKGFVPFSGVGRSLRD